jgi:hypothetical protein
MTTRRHKRGRATDLLTDDTVSDLSVAVELLKQQVKAFPDGPCCCAFVDCLRARMQHPHGTLARRIHGDGKPTQLGVDQLIAAGHTPQIARSFVQAGMALAGESDRMPMCLAYTHYASVDIDAVGTDGFTLRTSSRQTKLTLNYRSKLQWSSQGQVPPNRRPTAVYQQLFRVRASHTREQDLGIAVQLPKARPLQTCDEPRVDDGLGRHAGGVRHKKKARMWTGGKHGNWTVMPEPRKPEAQRVSK